VAVAVLSISWFRRLPSSPESKSAQLIAGSIFLLAAAILWAGVAVGELTEPRRGFNDPASIPLLAPSLMFAVAGVVLLWSCTRKSA
jgi:hypothetical protein